MPAKIMFTMTMDKEEKPNFKQIQFNKTKNHRHHQLER